MWTRNIFLMLCFIWLSAHVLPGQTTGSSNCSLTIPAIALLDIEPAGVPITLSMTPPTEAGNPLTIGAGGTNNSKWINYTSALAAGAATRSINVRVTSGSVPTGVSLKVQASTYSGTGAGVLGVPAGQVTVDNVARTVISGIGGCYTGDGVNRGHRLTYSISISNYSLLKFNQSSSLQITYTITD